MEQTTIAALATPPGRGGLAVIRLSGPGTETILRDIFEPRHKKNAFQNRFLMVGKAVFRGETLDECTAVLMRAPNSYTREDVAEIFVHGGEYIVSRVLKALFSLGAEPAAPGEFTRRAFLNGRIDLSQAEAVMQVVSAGGRQAANASLRQLQGGALRFAQEAQGVLLRLMAGVTAAIDYPEEIAEEEAVGDILPALDALALRLEEACDMRGAQILSEGLRVVLCGKPNVGKSSLFNALMREDRAIVTDIPGTTRDAIDGAVELGGIRVLLRDTAGIRDSGETVEKIGIKRALDAIQSADLCLMVMDGSRPADEQDEAILRATAEVPRLILFNKSDLPAYDSLTEWLEKSGILSGDKKYDDLLKQSAASREKISGDIVHDGTAEQGAVSRRLTSGGSLNDDMLLRVSAKTGEGMDILRQHIRAFAGDPGENALTLARHMRLAEAAANSLRQAAQAMREKMPLDLCAVDLNDALAALGDITGENISEALLDAVFSSFCVGK